MSLQNGNSASNPYSAQWVIVCTALLLLGAFVAFNALKERELVKNNEQERLRTQAKVVEQIIAWNIASLNKVMGDLQQDWLRNDDRRDLNARLETLVDGMPGVRTITFFDATGDILAASRAELIGKNFKTREYFIAAKNAEKSDVLLISPPFLSSLNAYITTISKPIKVGNDFSGAIVASLDPDFFKPLLLSVRYAPDMWLSIAHSDGKLFMLEPLPDKDILGMDIAQPGSFFTKHMESKQDSNVFTGKVYVTGEKCMMATQTLRFSDVENEGYMIVAAVRDYNAIFVHWKNDALRDCGMYILAVMILVFGLLFYQRKQRRLDREIRESRDRYRLLLNALHEGVYGTDTDGRITFINPGGLEILGYSDASEVLSKNSHSLLHHTHASGEAYKEEDCPLRDVLGENRTVIVGNEVFWRKDGTFFEVAYTAAPVVSEGRKLGSVVTFTDISDAKEAERQLHILTDRLSLATSGAKVGIWDYNLKTGKLVWDDAMYALYGVGPEKFSGAYEAWEAGLHPEDREAARSAFFRALEGAAEFTPEFRVVWPEDGSVHHIKANAVVQWDMQGAPVRILGTNWDITERKVAEEQLRQAEERYRTLVELLPDGIVLIDLESSKPLEFNEAAYQQLGYSREEFWNIGIENIEVDETPEEIETHIKKVCESGRDDFETRHRRRDGSLMHVLVTAKRVEVDGKGALLNVFRDITDKKQAAEALAASEARLKTIFERANLGIVFADADGDLLLFNQSFEDLVGYAASELAGLNYAMFTHPDDLPQEKELLQSVQRGEADEYRIEKRYKTKSGGMVWVDLAVAVIRDKSGQPMNFVGIMVDISERKHAEEALQLAHVQMEERVRERTADLEKALEDLHVAKEQAESANRMKSEFMGSITHELRTPLNGIQGLLQLLADSKLDAEQEDYVVEAEKAANRLLQMVNGVLSFTSLDHYSPVLAPVSLQGVMEFVTQNHGPKIAGKHLKLSTSLAPDCPEVIMVDMKLLQLVLDNLLSNAVKFTDSGEIRVMIDAAKVDAGEVACRFIVADTGQGILQDKMEAVTSGMGQADSSYSRQYGGIGLGIRTVRKALSLLKGDLEVESTPGQGTQFTVKLRTRFCDGDTVEECLLPEGESE